MTRITLVILLEFVVVVAYGQDYSVFRSRIKSMVEYGAIPDSAERSKKINELWSSLQNVHQIPLVIEDSVAFLYRGNAKTVEWTGDFNGWGYNKNVANKGRLIPGTDIWMFKASFPKDARLDYKVVLSCRTLILDPGNIHQQWSGVCCGSPNSELRMPDWKEDPVLVARNDIAHGTVKEEILFNSQILEYQVTYSVYLPANYSTMGKLPSLYV